MKYIHMITLAMLVIGCGSIVNTSELSSGLTTDRYGCVVNPNNSQNYNTSYSRFFRGSQIDDAFDSLSTMPAEYMQFAFDRFNTKVNVGGSGGLTQVSIKRLEDGREMRVPLQIPYSSVGALKHEFGHVMHGYFQEKYPEFQSDLVNTHRAAGLSYNERETLAVLFSRWYCNDSKRESLYSNNPTVYNFAMKYLVPAHETNDQPVIGSGSENVSVAMSKESSSTYKMYISNNSSSYSNIFYCVGSKDQCSSNTYLHQSPAMLQSRIYSLSVNVTPYSSLNNKNMWWIIGENANGTRSVLKGLEFTG